MIIFRVCLSLEDVKVFRDCFEEMDYRLSQAELPVMLLAYFLHPSYCAKFPIMLRNLEVCCGLSLEILGDICYFYYRRFVDDNLEKEDISRELQAWMTYAEFPESEIHFKDLDETPLQYWKRNVADSTFKCLVVLIFKHFKVPLDRYT